MLSFARSLCTLTALGVLATPAAANFSGFRIEDTNGHDEAEGTRSVRAYPLSNGESIEVDGRLDDASWSKAIAAGNFKVWDPNRGADPSQQTVFKVAYDKDAVYFAVACLDNDPDKVSSNLSRRDRDSRSDLVSVYVDPYFDRKTGYNFRVNPLGVQQDSYLYNDGETDTDWDAVWDAETFRDESGWYAEMRIPLSSIRYRSDAQTWGLQVYRYMHGRGEDTSWVTWDRDNSGFVSRFGQLTGIEDIPAPRQLDVFPYVVSRYTDPAALGDEDKDDFQNIGADLKYGITADLTLNATIQPDFGQVEADPATLNLSPFETFYSERRPFFIEGNRFYQMQNFDLFYSRRIGTGDSTSRIRFAGKLTGKVAGGVSIGALYASTDVTQPGQTHNLFKNGNQLSHFVVTRLGKEFSEGRHSFNLMQTAAIKTASRDDYGDRLSREAYTTGFDFQMKSPGRRYRAEGAFVGSVVDPEGLASDPTFDPAKSYGTGGALELYSSGGDRSAGVFGRWESARLDINDLGFLSSPDEVSAGVWSSHRYNPDGKSDLCNRAELNFNLNNSWTYAGRTGLDVHTLEPAWSYGRGHGQFLRTNTNGWTQLKNYWEAWMGLEYIPRGTQRFETRSTYLAEVRDEDTNELIGYRNAAIPGGGPLISEPATYGTWAGFNTDSRKKLVLQLESSYYADTAENYSWNIEPSVRWTQSPSINHELSTGYNVRLDDTQHLQNFENQNGGIGGVSYVFGDIDQRTVDLTLRTNVLFSRNQSLELYAQPFLTVGDYTNARELLRADTYDLGPYTRNGFRAEDSDFRFSSVNLNMVYRWEYRPGSTFFFVWTQGRTGYEERSLVSPGARFDNGLGTDVLFEDEAENVFLAKISYWFPI